MVRIIGSYRWFDGAYFDHTKYRESHLPLTARLLQPFGLRRLESDQSLTDAVPGPGQVVASSVAYFDTAEDARSALRGAGKELMADVANYSNISPELHLAAVSQHFPIDR